MDLQYTDNPLSTNLSKPLKTKLHSIFILHNAINQTMWEFWGYIDTVLWVFWEQHCSSHTSNLLIHVVVRVVVGQWGQSSMSGYASIWLELIFGPLSHVILFSESLLLDWLSLSSFVTGKASSTSLHSALSTLRQSLSKSKTLTAAYFWAALRSNPSPHPKPWPFWAAFRCNPFPNQKPRPLSSFVK